MPNDVSPLSLMFQPFHRIAGWTALGVGLVLMLLTAAIAAPCGTNFMTSLNIHVGKPAPFWVVFSLILIGWLTVSVLFLTAGKIFSSSKVRTVDVLGTLALTRGPFLLAAPLGLLTVPQNVLSPVLWASLLFCIVIDIWIVVLSYNAFAVSTNIKNKGAFAGLFVFSEFVGVIVSLPLLAFLALPLDPPSETSLASIRALEYHQEEADESALKRFEIARKTLLQLAEGKYDEIPADFNAEMKAALPVFALKTTWRSLILVKGPFEKTEPPVLVDEVEGYHRVKIPFRFEKGEKAVLLLAFDKDDKIAGLFIQPRRGSGDTVPGSQ